MLGSIVLAAVASFVIGFLLHGPVGGTLWMKLADVHPTGKEKFADMIPNMAWNLVANLFAAAALSMLIGHARQSPQFMALGGWGGAVFGVFAWVLLSAGSSIEVIWMKRRPALWLYEVGCSLVATVAMGYILGLAF
ncbi:MAG: hypothetical protein RLZZ324_1312 [Candidatus Parcubacteria bacterium]|jgi:hypothetical protein